MLTNDVNIWRYYDFWTFLIRSIYSSATFDSDELYVMGMKFSTYQMNLTSMRNMNFYTTLTWPNIYRNYNSYVMIRFVFLSSLLCISSLLIYKYTMCPCHVTLCPPNPVRISLSYSILLEGCRSFLKIICHWNFKIQLTISKINCPFLLRRCRMNTGRHFTPQVA